MKENISPKLLSELESQNLERDGTCKACGSLVATIVNGNLSNFVIDDLDRDGWNGIDTLIEKCSFCCRSDGPNLLLRPNISNISRISNRRDLDRILLDSSFMRQRFPRKVGCRKCGGYDHDQRTCPEWVEEFKNFGRSMIDKYGKAVANRIPVRIANEMFIQRMKGDTALPNVEQLSLNPQPFDSKALEIPIQPGQSISMTGFGVGTLHAGYNDAGSFHSAPVPLSVFTGSNGGVVVSKGGIGSASAGRDRNNGKRNIKELARQVAGGCAGPKVYQSVNLDDFVNPELAQAITKQDWRWAAHEFDKRADKLAAAECRIYADYLECKTAGEEFVDTGSLIKLKGNGTPYDHEKAIRTVLNAINNGKW